MKNGTQVAKRVNLVRGGLKKPNTVNLGLWPKLGGGSGPVRRAQLSYLVIRNGETTSHFLKVTPLIWAIEGQNNESKTNKGPNFRGGEGVRNISAKGPNLPCFFFEAFPKQLFTMKKKKSNKMT